MKQFYRFQNTNTDDVFVVQMTYAEMREYLANNPHIVLYRIS